MAVALEHQQPLSSPRKRSLWKRIASKREFTPTPRAVTTQKPTTNTTTSSPTSQSTHFPPAGTVETPTEIASCTQRNATNKPITMIKVQHIEIPTTQGTPGPIPSTRVSSSDMRTTPFPSSPHVRTVGWNIFLTPEQMHNLVMGFRPVGLDDKWFIYSQGPDRSGKLKVHVHLSWTGMKIAELFIIVDLVGEGAGTIVGIKWNGTEQTNGMDEEEAKYLVSTMCLWVLDVDLERGGSGFCRR